MTENQLSRKKLVEYLKSAKIDITCETEEQRYMYSLGRNMLADVLISGIMMGDFDE